MEILILLLTLLAVGELTYLVITLSPQKRLKRTQRAIFIDTSVLIDGRILAIAESGFISDTLMIPRSVIGELQLLADSADNEKRERARHGLDVVAELQALPQVKVEIYPDSTRADEGVDERLLTLAKKHGGALCTIDFNLNKVARVEGTEVLNVNELAKQLRVTYLPGEQLPLALTTKGNDSTQAVGHLSDGTMVVVEKAKTKIGTTVMVEVIRSLQTAAGKMIFARLVEDKSDAKKHTATPSPVIVQKRISKQVHKGRKRVDTSKKQKNDGEVSLAPSPNMKESEVSEHKLVRHEKAQKPTAKVKAPRRRPPTSRDNEARLIELVNKQ